MIKTVIQRLYPSEVAAFPALPPQKLTGIRAVIKDIQEYLDKHEFLAGTLKVLLVAVIAAAIWGLIHSYNAYASWKTNAQAYFAQVGVELKRRNNLVPNLIVAVKKYAVHEEEIFKHVSDAREMLVQAKGIQEKMQAAHQLDTALSKLLAVVEQYPDLKATQSVQDLIKEIANTEDRIAEQKGKYNEAAKEYNQLFTAFPTNILGKIYGFRRPLPYMGIEEDKLEVPRIQSEWKEDLSNE